MTKIIFFSFFFLKMASGLELVEIKSLDNASLNKKERIDILEQSLGHWRSQLLSLYEKVILLEKKLHEEAIERERLQKKINSLELLIQQSKINHAIK